MCPISGSFCAKSYFNVDVVQDASNVNIKHLYSPQGQEMVHSSILGILFARLFKISQNKNLKSVQIDPRKVRMLPSGIAA